MEQRQAWVRRVGPMGVALLAAGPALAQGAVPPAAPEAGLADIVVTAERRAARLQDTPISITAVTADALAERGVRAINDLGGAVPNLSSTTGPQGSADANFFIRGVGQFDFIVTNDTGVGLYVDGVFIGRTVGAMLDAADLARVEVLRGPQGTLFGRNTLGGAVSIITQPPLLGEVSGEAGGGLGSRNRVELDGRVNVPLGERAAFRLGAFVREQDGFADNPDRGVSFGAIDRRGTRGSILFEPSAAVTLRLSADYSLDRSNPAPSVLLAIAPLPFFPPDAGADRSTDFNRSFASNSPEARNEVFGLSLDASVQLGSATLRSITAWRELDGFSTSDPDGTGYRLYDQETDTRQRQFSQELQVAGDALGRLAYVAGAYAFREKAAQELRLCFAPITDPPARRGNPCNTWNQANDQTTESFALFGQLRFALADTVSATLGGRYSWETKRNVSNQAFDFREAGAGFGAIVIFGLPLSFGQRVLFPIVADLPGELSFERFTPRVGLEWKPTPDTLVFGSFAQGFRSGGFNGRLIAPQASIPTYAPDTNDAFELGIKTDLFARMLRLNATAFAQNYRGIQQTISDPAVQFRVANAGDARLWGFEVEANAVPLAGLRLDLGLGYTDSRFRNVPAAVGPVNGNRLPFSPEWNIVAGAQYALTLGELGTLTPRADWRWQSRVFFSPFNLPLEQQGSYGLLSARLTWVDAGDRLSASVYGENLTREEYFTFGQNALAAQGVAYNYIGRPREFGLRASFRF